MIPACPTCGTRVLTGYQVQGVYDGALFWVCSNGHATARFTGKNRLADLSRMHADRYNNRTERERQRF